MANKKKNIQLILPIVIGNEAERLPDNAPEKFNQLTKDHTHRWCIYVRGANNEDISYFIDRVLIKLHESFPDCRRSIHQPPYEVNETGWGEFDIELSIWIIGMATPIKLTHTLRLFPAEDDNFLIPNVQDPTRPGILVTERYDEILVNEPSDELFNSVLSHCHLSHPVKGPVWNKVTEYEEISRFNKVHNDVQHLIHSTQLKITEAQAEIRCLRGGHS